MSDTVTVGKKVPDFQLPVSGGGTLSLASLRGSRVVLYFYPRDNTPGCTIESRSFRDKMRSFSRHNATVVGVSRDSVKSHDKFKEKYKLPFDLGSDESEEVCTLFGVVKMKNMYGKKVRGIERSTFLIDEEGVLRREWRKVRILGHVEEVLEAVRALD